MPAIGEWWTSVTTGITYQVTHVFYEKETLTFSQGGPIRGKFGDTLLSSMEDLSKRVVVPQEDLIRHFLCIKRKSPILCQQHYVPGAAMSEQEANERITLLEVSTARLEERGNYHAQAMGEIREDIAGVKRSVDKISDDLSRARGLVFGIVITLSALFNMLAFSWEYIRKKLGV